MWTESYGNGTVVTTQIHLETVSAERDFLSPSCTRSLSTKIHHASMIFFLFSLLFLAIFFFFFLSPFYDISHPVYTGKKLIRLDKKAHDEFV